MPTSSRTENRKTRDGSDQMAAYSEAVKSGLYMKRSGIIGKYDNVRERDHVN